VISRPRTTRSRPDARAASSSSSSNVRGDRGATRNSWPLGEPLWMAIRVGAVPPPAVMAGPVSAMTEPNEAVAVTESRYSTDLQRGTHTDHVKCLAERIPSTLMPGWNLASSIFRDFDFDAPDYCRRR
jgi:hypothetical protein